MIVDKANAANIYAGTRAQGQEKGSGPPDRQADSGGGQTGDAGPAVVADLSSAVLETSRGVKAAEQASDQNGAGGADEKDTSGTSDKRRQPLDVII